MPNWTNFYNLEGNSNDAIASANGTDTSITYSTGNGKINQGAGFNGTNSAFSLPIALGNAGTINLWFKRADTSTANSSMFGATTIAIQDYIRINPSTTTLQFICQGEVLSPAWTADTNWHMATIVWDTLTAWAGYLDGVLYATGGAIRNPAGNANLRAGITANGTGIYTIGQTYYNGALDLVAYSTQRATLAQIQTEYNGGAGRSYPFRTTSPTTFLLGV